MVSGLLFIEFNKKHLGYPILNDKLFALYINLYGHYGPHSASYWKPVGFRSHFPDICSIFNWLSWTLANLLRWTFNYLGHYKKIEIDFDWLIFSALN